MTKQKPNYRNQVPQSHQHEYLEEKHHLRIRPPVSSTAK